MGKRKKKGKVIIDGDLIFINKAWYSKKWPDPSDIRGVRGDVLRVCDHKTHVYTEAKSVKGYKYRCLSVDCGLVWYILVEDIGFKEAVHDPE